MNQASEQSKKLKIMQIAGWGLLMAGIVLYIVPFFYDYLGHNSGLFAFILAFSGISLLKMRKDQRDTD